MLDGFEYAEINAKVMREFVSSTHIYINDCLQI